MVHILTQTGKQFPCL